MAWAGAVALVAHTDAAILEMTQHERSGRDMSDKTTVWDDEVSATEQWIGRPYPETLKTLWSEMGHGPVEGGALLGPFDIADAAMPGAGAPLPFFRSNDGRTFRIDAEGRVVDPSGARIGLTAAEVVRQSRDLAALEAAVARASGNAFSRGLRSLVAAVSTRRDQAQA